MKIFSFLVFLLFSISITNAQENVSSTADVTYLGKSENGTIFLSSCGYGKTLNKKAYLAAVKNAFETLMFRGIPDSEVPNALIENEAIAKTNSAKYFEDFFEGGRYKSFLTSIHETKPTKEFKRKKLV
ncbi:MAG: hypothetical protein IPN09_13325 [Bacteroidetes bacterium]|nr:hypothetical protein [Bacteroidota bacterium]